LKPIPLILVLLVAALAGFWDSRWRRIPNWLTVAGLIAGVAANTILSGLAGLKTSLLGAGLGLLVLLPFVFLRSLGAGDWKLAGALGAFVGWRVLADLLIASMFVAGLMAVVLIVYKRRVLETLRNMARMLAALLTLHMPGAEVSLDNPRALKIPYGVALALTTMAYAIMSLKVLWGAR
jgi:prepilin peptidase CpaA